MTDDIHVLAEEDGWRIYRHAWDAEMGWLYVRHDWWEETEVQGVDLAHIARSLRTMRHAIEAGANTTVGGGGTYTIPSEDVPLVLKMLESVLPQAISDADPETWRRVHIRDRLDTMVELRRLGAPQSVLDAVQPRGKG